MPYTPIALTATLMVAAAIANAQDRKITRTSLPAAVAAAADRETGSDQVKGYATEREHGKQVYEVETVRNGHTRDLQFATDGTLNEVEEEVAMDSLPAEVRDALQKKAGAATIEKVESLTKQGKLVAYEASTRKGAKTGEVQVGPKGEKLTHEE